MRNLLLMINNYFASVPDQLRPWRWWILSLVLVLTVLMTVGISRFTLDVTFDAWFSDDDPVLKALDDFWSNYDPEHHELEHQGRPRPQIAQHRPRNKKQRCRENKGNRGPDGTGILLRRCHQIREERTTTNQ